MKRSVIWFGRARPRRRIFARNVSNFFSFLLRHGRIFMGHKHWTQAHRRWLAGQKFERPAQQIVFQDAIDAIEDATTRAQRLEEQLALIVPSWSMAPVVAAYQAMRGVSFVVAVTFAAEIGDVRRFDKARQVTAFVGLVPSERSTGESVRRGGLTLAGNRRARRALIEAAWTYAMKGARGAADKVIIEEDREILETTDPDAIVDMSRKIEMHMPSDRPGMIYAHAAQPAIEGAWRDRGPGRA